MITEEIRGMLFGLQDRAYGDFQKKLIPTVTAEAFIGVRTPALRALARQLKNRPDVGQFLEALPHRYFDENQLHAFLLSEDRTFEACLTGVEAFLPFVDNWATCDQLTPRVFKAHRQELLPAIRRWLVSEAVYTRRFGIKMLMDHFLDEAYDPAYPALVAELRTEAYYVRMMAAWYFATALAKQYDGAISYLTERRLDPWTHNRAIQKAVESFRITPAQKAYLRSLRIKTKQGGTTTRDLHLPCRCDTIQPDKIRTEG